MDVKPHSWFSNPLDWPHIDRILLLSSLALQVPVYFGGALLGMLIWAPEWMNQRIAWISVIVYAVYFSVVLGYSLVALKRRTRQEHWSAFENIIIYPYIAVILLQAYISGTHFSSGMLLLMFGAYITSALADLRKVYRAYFAVALIFAFFIFADVTELFPYAPIFKKYPIQKNGAPVWGWYVFQMVPVVAILAFTHIGLMATRRWVERENLYREMSTTDGLTRLTNRRSFIERSENEFARAARIPVTGISCIMIDIDHFKRINDTLGHQAGDKVLVETSALLLKHARPYDEVGRYGGEEFAILLPNTSLEIAGDVAERIRGLIAENTINVGKKSIRVTASFGVASFPGNRIGTINDLLKAADDALYRAKRAGRNRVAVTKKILKSAKPAKARR